MKRSRTAITQTLALALWCLSSHSWSAERRPWVELTECRYVNQKYNDGDSFHVRCGASELIVRLYFVDAPEATMRYPERVQEQSDYFGVTLDETLRAGKQAKVAVQEALQSPFIVWTRRASAGGRSRIPRYYCYVEVGKQGLAELLVSKGLAQTKGVTAASPKGEPSRVLRGKLEALELDARQQRRGVWATSRAGAARDPQ